MNFGLLLLAGVAILLSCLGGMLTVTSWRNRRYRSWFLSATLLFIATALICSWLLLHH